MHEVSIEIVASSEPAIAIIARHRYWVK